MLVRLIISALILSLHLANSNPVLEYQDQEEPHRELMFDQPQKVNRGEMSRLQDFKTLKRLCKAKL